MNLFDSALTVYWEIVAISLPLVLWTIYKDLRGNFSKIHPSNRDLAKRYGSSGITIGESLFRILLAFIPIMNGLVGAFILLKIIIDLSKEYLYQVSDFLGTPLSKFWRRK